MFYMYVFFRVPNWPKICIFLGLGFNSTSGSHVIFFQESQPWASDVLIFEKFTDRIKICEVLQN